MSNKELERLVEENQSLENMNFDGMDLTCFNFKGKNLKNASFVNTNLEGVDFRNANLEGVNISGANLFGSMLEGANLNNIVSDDSTKFFKLHCPEKGAFLGYKKCFNSRMVTLLIPADAKRTSATLTSCRSDKAKVLSIKSIDYKISYNDASAFVNEDFIYRVGQTVYASGFTEDRWVESTQGIHYYLTRKEAEAYL